MEFPRKTAGLEKSNLNHPLLRHSPAGDKKRVGEVPPSQYWNVYFEPLLNGS